MYGELRASGHQARTVGSFWPLIGFAVCVAAVVSDAVIVEPRRIVLERVDIPIWNLPNAFDGYRIALVSDLHYPRWTGRKFVHKALAVANSLQPDLIALLGDNRDRGREERPTYPTSPAYSILPAPMKL